MIFCQALFECKLMSVCVRINVAFEIFMLFNYLPGEKAAYKQKYKSAYVPTFHSRSLCAHSERISTRPPIIYQTSALSAKPTTSASSSSKNSASSSVR